MQELFLVVTEESKATSISCSIPDNPLSLTGPLIDRSWRYTDVVLISFKYYATPPCSQHPWKNTLETECCKAGSVLGRESLVLGQHAPLGEKVYWGRWIWKVEEERLSRKMLEEGFFFFEWWWWWGGCWCSLVLRGNISKVRRKSCQINFSPFQSRPGEFLSHFTSADLGPFFSASVGLTPRKDPAPSHQPQKSSESLVNGKKTLPIPVVEK